MPKAEEKINFAELFSLTTTGKATEFPAPPDGSDKPTWKENLKKSWGSINAEGDITPGGKYGKTFEDTVAQQAYFYNDILKETGVDFFTEPNLVLNPDKSIHFAV